MEDTTTSVLCGGQVPGSSTTISSRASNSTFARGCTLSRSCSVSPELRRTVSPVGLSIVQCCSQLAERTLETAMFSIGHIAEATRQAHGVAKAAIAEATTMRSHVESRITALQEKVEFSMSRAIGEVSRWLEQSLEAVALGTIVASACNTHATVQGLCTEL